MIRFPLYESWLPGVDLVEPRPREDKCERCSLGQNSERKHRNCAPPLVDMGDGKGDLIMLLGAAATQEEHRSGQWFTNWVWTWTREKARKYHAGPVIMTHAVRCHGKPDDTTYTACRPYLAADLDLTQPKISRVIAVGQEAAMAVFGMKVPHGLRRCWAYARGVPVFFMANPLSVTANRFLAKQTESDLKWGLTAAAPSIPDGSTWVLQTADEVVAFLDALTDAPVVVDIENAGELWAESYRLLCVGLCQDVQEPVVIPVSLLTGATLERFVKFVEDPRYPKVGQNIKYDAQGIFRATGAVLAGIEADTMLWRRVLASDSPAGLNDTSWLVGMGGYKSAALQGRKHAALNEDTLHAYNGRDTSATLRLYERELPRMTTHKLDKTWRSLTGPAVSALAQVERWGALLSKDAVELYDRWLTEQLRVIDDEVYKYPEVQEVAAFSYTSAQLAQVIFKKLGLKSLVRTPTGKPSTAAAVLRAMQNEHPLIPHFIEHARWMKQKTTYGTPMLRHIGSDGRVHTNYGMVRSGRLSSSDPNLQNITSAGKEEGVWARGCWPAPPGYVLLEADYSQMELRVAAMLSQDETMAAAFASGTDFHAATACMITGKTLATIGPDERRAAKVVNFGLLYGKGPRGLALDLGISEDAAKKYVNAILGKYRRLAQFRRECVSAAELTGESVVEWNGWVHRRANTAIGALGDEVVQGASRGHGRNIALNDPIQNMANNFCLASLIEIVRWISDENVPAKVVITVHDSILLEVREDLLHDVAAEVRAIMLQWPSGIVKFAVDMKTGPTWGSLVKLEI